MSARVWEETELPPHVQATITHVKEAAYRIHRRLGAGFKETVYQQCMAHSLARAGVPFLEHPALTVEFDGLVIRNAGEPDFLVNDCVIVELKTAQQRHPVHAAQVINYLKASALPAGVLINFNVVLMKHGFDQYVLPELLRPRSPPE